MSRTRATGGRALCAAVLALGLLASPTPAAASPRQEAQALKKFMEGKKAFQRGSFEEALGAFKASIELQPSPNSRLYIARCYRAMGKTASAYTTFKHAAQEAQDRLKATGERRYKPTVAAALAEAAELERKVPRLTIAIPADVPEGYAVSMDGEALQKSAWGTAIEVDPGEHEVVATGPRIQRFARKVTLKPGESQRLEVTAVRVPTGIVTLSMAARPEGLAVEVDGAPLAPDSFEKPQHLDVGQHTIVVRAPGHKDFVWMKPVADRDQITVTVDLVARRTGTPQWLFYTIASGAVVSIGIGMGFSLKAESAAKREVAKDPLLRSPSVQEQIKSDRTTALVLYVAGGAMAATAGVLAFTTAWRGGARREKARRTAFRPWIAPQGLGFSAEGGF